jgi:hypothetical protein
MSENPEIMPRDFDRTTDHSVYAHDYRKAQTESPDATRPETCANCEYITTGGHGPATPVAFHHCSRSTSHREVRIQLLDALSPCFHFDVWRIVQLYQSGNNDVLRDVDLQHFCSKKWTQVVHCCSTSATYTPREVHEAGHDNDAYRGGNPVNIDASILRITLLPNVDCLDETL